MSARAGKVKWHTASLLVCMALAACPKTEVIDEVDPLRSAEQLVLVRTTSWEDGTATLEWFERRAPGQPWERKGGPEKATAAAGLAWGRGLHTGRIRNGPVKLEGDGRAPAGAFELSAVFGLSSARPSVRLPYLHLNERMICVNDAESRRYNHIVDPDFIDDEDWRSSEPVPQTLGIVVDHNTGELFVKGSGSCTFLHATTESVPAAASATVTSAEVVDALVTWLDPARYPVLVQLPSDEALRLAAPWGLPLAPES